MASIATTKLSSKGQVVIPEEIRKQLGLKEGDQFVVVGQDDEGKKNEGKKKAKRVRSRIKNNKGIL